MSRALDLPGVQCYSPRLALPVPQFPTIAPPHSAPPPGADDAKLNQLLTTIESYRVVLAPPAHGELVRIITDECEQVGYTAETTEGLGSLIVETAPGVGKVLLMDDTALKNAIDAPEPTLDLDDPCVDGFFDTIVKLLKLGGMVMVGGGYLKLIPSDMQAGAADALNSIRSAIAWPGSRSRAWSHEQWTSNSP